MKHASIALVTDRLNAIRRALDVIRATIDAEALPVGDRNLMEHALSTIQGEIDVLDATLADLLTDPTKVG